MAKKKQKNWQTYIKKPLSVKQSIIGGIFVLSLFTLNTVVFTQTKPQQTSIPNTQQQVKTDVLGESITNEQEINSAYTAFFQKQEVVYWLSIIKEKPAYPDAYRVLAVLAYNDHNCQLAQQYISTALELNRVDTTLHELQNRITSCTTSK